MSIARYFAFGEETTFGTAVPAVEYVDPESAELDPSGDQASIYEGISRLDRIVAAGPYTSEGSVVMPFDLVAFPWFLKWTLGGYEVTGSDPSHTHRFYPSQSALMQSFTARVGKDVFEHVFTGCVVSKLEINLDNGFLLGHVQVKGGRDEKGTLQSNPTLTQGEIYSPDKVTVTIDGNDESVYVESFSITIETGANNEAGLTVGSRFPRRAYRGALTVEVELSLSFFSTTQLERFWGATDGPIEGALSEHNMTIHVGNNIDILIPRFVYTGMTQPLGGRDRIEQTATLRALVANDGTGPIEFSITNNKASY